MMELFVEYSYLFSKYRSLNIIDWTAPEEMVFIFFRRPFTDFT